MVMGEELEDVPETDVVEVANGFILSVDVVQAPGVVVGAPFAILKQYGCFVTESKSVTPDGVDEEPTVTFATVRRSKKPCAA